jgi:hypothetical protein
VIVRQGDIVFVRSNTRIGALIRFFTRTPPWESPTKVNHVGMITTDMGFDQAFAVEALNIVHEHRLWTFYHGQACELAIYRPLNVPREQINRIIDSARHYIGDGYGYAKIVTSLLDWCLCGAYVFRRLTHAQKWPICSWVVAHAYAAVGLNFGVDPGAATPDDIWDFVKSHPAKYECVKPLGVL